MISDYELALAERSAERNGLHQLQEIIKRLRAAENMNELYRQDIAELMRKQ